MMGKVINEEQKEKLDAYLSKCPNCSRAYMIDVNILSKLMRMNVRTQWEDVDDYVQAIYKKRFNI